MIYSGIEWMIYVLQLFFLNSEQLKTINVRVELGGSVFKRMSEFIKILLQYVLLWNIDVNIKLNMYPFKSRNSPKVPIM